MTEKNDKEKKNSEKRTWECLITSSDVAKKRKLSQNQQSEDNVRK
jgi:hypothetical protein